MAEQLHLPLTVRRCPPSIAEGMRQRYLVVMGELAAHYGVSSLSLRIQGREVQLVGPRGGLHARARVLPSQPMPAVTDPRWYGWCAQVALWVHRSRGCRGCGRPLQRVHLDRFGHCPDCRREAKRDRIQLQLAGFYDAALKSSGPENVRRAA